ncbi:MAG: hypothetical protein HYW14_00265 [Planctomycetes bacterium]|nr:hypothetical protein [Planctomycetota bacterium]
MANAKPKTGVILAIMFGLFGILCACLAITATDKYRTQKARVKRLEQKLAAGKQEVIKVPTLQLQAMEAEGKKKSLESDLEGLTTERDELSSQCDELKTELQTMKIAEAYYASEKANMVKTIGELREKLSVVAKASDKITALEAEKKALLNELAAIKSEKTAAEKGIAELQAILAKRGPAVEEAAPTVEAKAPTLVREDVKEVQHLLADTEKEKAKLEKKVNLLETKNKNLTQELDTLKKTLASVQEKPKLEEETEVVQLADTIKKTIETASAELLPGLKEALTDLRKKVESPYTAERDLLKAFKETETRLSSIESALTPMVKTVGELREKLSLVNTASTSEKITVLETENKEILKELSTVKSEKTAAEKSLIKLEATLTKRGPAVEEIKKEDIKAAQHLLADTEKEKVRLEKKVSLLELKNKNLTQELDTLKKTFDAVQEKPKLEEETEAEQIASSLKKVIETASTELLPGLKESLINLRKGICSRLLKKLR